MVIHTSVFERILTWRLLVTQRARGLHRTFKTVLMKKVVLSFFAAAVAFVSFGQDASQPQGSWYLGSGDATTLLNVFSSGVSMDATVGYAVADDIVVTAMTGFGGALDSLNLSLGGQYFMGDYYVGLQLLDPLNDFDLGLNAGRYIDFKDVLYITPQLNLDMLTTEPELSISIGVGARF